jgi:hypothetical protein
MQQWVVDKVVQIEAEMSSKGTQSWPTIWTEDTPNQARPKSLREHRIQQLKLWSGAIENFEPQEQAEALCEIKRIVQALEETTVECGGNGSSCHLVQHDGAVNGSQQK